MIISSASLIYTKEKAYRGGETGRGQNQEISLEATKSKWAKENPPQKTGNVQKTLENRTANKTQRNTETEKGQRHKT